MTVFIYVEGDADARALRILLRKYADALAKQGHGLTFIPLDDKHRFLRKIGRHVAETLVGDPEDRVVALPDLYPNEPFRDMPAYAHANLAELRGVLTRLAKDTLQGPPFNVGSPRLDVMLKRFLPSALKHELEMLLLAAWRRLGKHVGVELNPDKWRHPVEDQNQIKAGCPKHKVESIFLHRMEKPRKYQDTIDAPAVLARVEDIKRELLYSQSGQPECPEFQGFLDWLARETGVPAY